MQASANTGNQVTYITEIMSNIILKDYDDSASDKEGISATRHDFTKDWECGGVSGAGKKSDYHQYSEILQRILERRQQVPARISFKSEGKCVCV